MSNDRAIWQIWGGPGEGTFAQSFLRYGVALVGPGGPGPWTDGRSDEDYIDDQGTGGSSVRRFAEEVRVGDVFLMRTGVRRLMAVGIVAGEYEFLDRFDGLLGWDVPHTRRLRWFQLPQPYEFRGDAFAGQQRFSRVLAADPVDVAKRLLVTPPLQWQTLALPGMPPDDPPLDDVPEALRSVIGLAQDLAPLYWSIQHFGERPREDELVAHFIVPLLRQCGWPPERIAVKWRNVDVATFRTLPRSPENCEFVVEAKRPGEWPEKALGQAQGYLKQLGIDRDIILTDGIRYHLYGANQGFAHVAHANLSRPRASSLTLLERLKPR